MFQNKKQAVVEEEKTKGNIETLTFLGTGTEFKGKVIFQGTLRVDGVLEGEIEGNETLILGESGTITGVCKIAKAMVSGKLRGDIYATEKVVLKKNADFSGKIVTPSLIVEEGAGFNGTCKMSGENQFPRYDEEMPAENVSVIKI